MKKTAFALILLVTLFLTIALFNAPMTNANANQLTYLPPPLPTPTPTPKPTFSSGLTLYSPLNTTYYSHVVLCNGTFKCPKGFQSSLNYSLDGEYQGGLLWSLNPNSIVDPYIYVVNGSFPLPQLPNGSHRLSIGIDEELYSGGAIVKRASWVNTVYFTINSNQPMTTPTPTVPEFPSWNAQPTGDVIINADGSVTGTSNIQQTGSTYTLTGNISGTIQVQKSNIIINGAGYALTDEGGVDLTNDVQHDPTRPVISNVTIENLCIVNGGIGTNGGGYDTFYNDYISNSQGYCIFLMGDCDYNNITFCTIKGSNETAAIGIVYGANYNGTITENNITGGIMIWLSEGGTVDRNYWSDYLTKYPNATEIDNSGIGDTPYVFSAAQNGSETIYYQDDHPLMKPVSITVPEFPSWTVLPLLIVMVIVISFLVYFKKHKR